ncbi:hypothetical protein, conserved [Plasmodium vivax]|uniref:N-alpha-acetyltransferase 15, NatA auxiliary subunit n=1 Tax=Plasmodium vivax (strain Salvador I) TaxID=126793 RepID=A5K8U4_PLAVS|nr:hypothetical protein, conserved [Plasmodium vivax]EDL44240.1 hypothetical protein, conserved [Plasmodium vivax]|eukprot:XP_001613967.1 hypothetical protein [Plasmodium vivax Sal-1]
MKKDAADNNKLTNKEMNNFRLMTQLIELKKHKKAFKICEQILKKYPKNGETLAVKGYLLNLMDEKNKEEAFKLIKEGIVNNISSSFCWYLYGCLYKIYKNNDEALKCYLKAVKLNRYDYKALKEACILLLYLGRYEQFKDLRIDVYKDTVKGVRDKAILIFAFHLLKQYEKCFIIINQLKDELAPKGSAIRDPIKGSDLNPIEKHDLIVYMCEILLEGKLYGACLDLLKTHEEELLDKLWYNKMVGLVYLFEGKFEQANLHFRKAFEMNYENLNILLLILYTERSYSLDGRGSSGEADDAAKKGRTLSSLFFLDYKDEHKMDDQVEVDEHVKVLLHDFILDVYGSNRNLKLLARKEKNVLNDYVSHNWGMKKYDVYTLSEFNNFVNVNLVEEKHFKQNLHLENTDEYIHSMRESIQTEMNNIAKGEDVHSYNIIHWSEKLGVDLPFCYKKKFEKCMNMIHFYKIKNLNEEEENCFENYFTNLQKSYKHSNLLKIFPLYFYNEKKFSFHVEKLLRSLCYQKCLTIFSYFRPFFTYKNVKIILFLLHKYVENYERVRDIPPFDCGTVCAEIGGCYDCLGGDINQAGEESPQKEAQGWVEEAPEKREFTPEKNHEEDHPNGEAINGELPTGEDKHHLESTNGEAEETPQVSGEKKLVDNFLDETEEMKNIIGMATPLGGGEKTQKKDQNGKKIESGSGKKNPDEGKEKKEIKLDLKKVTLTEEERKEYFMLCIHSFVSQLYDYINCAEESLALLKDSSKKISFKVNESVKQELVFIKGLIYKRNGNYLEAYTHLEECRLANIGDRYINSKTIKTCLKCGLIKDAKKMASIFTNPLDNNFMKNINETQCFWLEFSISQSFFNNHPNVHLGRYLSLGPDSLYDFGGEEAEKGDAALGSEAALEGEAALESEAVAKRDATGDPCGKSVERPKLNLRRSILVDNDMLGRNELNDYSRGLHYLHMGHKQFLDIHEDQICFYYYTIRKMLYRSYRHLLCLTSEMFSCRFYRKFGKALIKALLHIHDCGLLKKNDLNKKSKKKTKPSVASQDESEIYEHIKNDPLENAMIYMKTFLSQPNVDLSVYKLKFDIERRSPDKDYAAMIDTLLTMKTIFPHHNYNYKFGPAISFYLCAVRLDSASEEQGKEITSKLNDLLGLNHPAYGTELLKEVRAQYMESFVKFFNEHKKGDLRYYQSALEMYLDCDERVDEGLLEKAYIDPKKNKLTRCLKFLRFLIKWEGKHAELAPLLDHFKTCCREAFPLATAFQ